MKESPSDIGATSKEKNNIVIPEFSAWLTLVLEQCRAENIRNLPRQRVGTPSAPATALMNKRNSATIIPHSRMR